MTCAVDKSVSDALCISRGGGPKRGLALNKDGEG